MKNVKRGIYDEIIKSQLNKKTLKSVETLVDAAAKSEKVDEHGNWEFGINFNRKRKGSALNWDLYDIGKDFHTKKMLIIIQVREFSNIKYKKYAQIHKSYFLIGRNEDKAVFAHPVEAKVVRHAIKKNKDVIYAVQSWMFETDYKKVIRQGDIAVIPIKKANGNLLSVNKIIIEGSHELLADEIYKKSNDLFYALNPTLMHLPNTHKEVSCEGLYKIVVSNRASYWEFAAPTKD